MGGLRHFLTIDGLNSALLIHILDTAEGFIDRATGMFKKAPLLNNSVVANLFFEPSTRTRCTFELAARHLGAEVLNLDLERSSSTKGETLLDTLHNLESMQCSIFVVRHSENNVPEYMAQHASPNSIIINAGDGTHAHPTQAMLDMFTIRRHKGRFNNLRIVIVGDILHSRVARSTISALKILGANDLHVIAPKSLLPNDIAMDGISIHHDFDIGIKDADVIIMLRIQKERMDGASIPNEADYFQYYGLTPQRLKLAKADAIVMHPGPINRGVEIDSAVADGPQSVILKQVTYGVAIRMAILSMTTTQSKKY